VADSRSTAPPTISVDRLRRTRLLRRGFFAFICLVLLAAALGRLGVHTTTAEASGGGYELSVTYDDITRSGLAANLSIEIRRSGAALPATVTVATGSSYGDSFDLNGVDPEPEETYTTEDRVVQKFRAPPGGDVMTIGIDQRVQPGVQFTRVKGEVALVDDSGNDVVSVRLSTFVMP
jgi:hypothetical protein